jgi:hypothetical protein
MKPPQFYGLLMLAVFPCASPAQVELRGRLLSQSGSPIVGATILVGGIGFTVRSDSAGRFALAGGKGATLQLYFTAPGFRRDSGRVSLGSAPLVRDFTLIHADTPMPEANPSASTLRGSVVDETGVPLSYANVQVGDDAVNGIALPTHVAAMEIYPRGVSAPPQYQSRNGTCGVVLIWTK